MRITGPSSHHDINFNLTLSNTTAEWLFLRPAEKPSLIRKLSLPDSAMGALFIHYCIYILGVPTRLPSNQQVAIFVQVKVEGNHLWEAGIAQRLLALA